MEISREDKQALDSLLERINRAPLNEPWHVGATERMILLNEAIVIFKRYPSEAKATISDPFLAGIDGDFYELTLQDRIDYYNNVLNPSKRKYPNKQEQNDYSDWQMSCIMTERRVPETLTTKRWAELKAQWGK